MVFYWDGGGGCNSRIDRIYVNNNNMKDITNMRYIQTPFHGHRVFSFAIKNHAEWGRSYYKLNTSLFENEEYDQIVEDTLAEIDLMRNRTNRHKWERGG